VAPLKYPRFRRVWGYIHCNDSLRAKSISFPDVNTEKESSSRTWKTSLSLEGRWRLLLSHCQEREHPCLISICDSQDGCSDRIQVWQYFQVSWRKIGLENQFPERCLALVHRWHRAKLASHVRTNHSKEGKFWPSISSKKVDHNDKYISISSEWQWYPYWLKRGCRAVYLRQTTHVLW
jgi:hypothetical protein